MTKAERVQFEKWANSLSDDELEKEYYETVYSTLGSEAEEMYERGWDMADVLEREKYERDLGIKARILEGLCVKRGIKLWEDGDNNTKVMKTEVHEMNEVDFAALDQFEFEGVKCSLFGRFSVKEFCTMFLAGEFPRTSTYLLKIEGVPSQPISHRTMELNLEKLFCNQHEETMVAVYERMTPLGVPEMTCGNCRYFFRHYVASDEALGLTLLPDGHCAESGRIIDRKRDEKADKKNCFEWNAECRATLEYLQQLRAVKGRNDEDHFAVLLNKRGRRL